MDKALSWDYWVPGLSVTIGHFQCNAFFWGFPKSGGSLWDPPKSGGSQKDPPLFRGYTYTNPLGDNRSQIPSKLRYTAKKKIYIENSGFCEGIFTQIPWARRGFWKFPRARRAARGNFQNPRTGDGDLGKSPIKNQNFVHIFFIYNLLPISFILT